MVQTLEAINPKNVVYRESFAGTGTFNNSYSLRGSQFLGFGGGGEGTERNSGETFG